MFVGSPALYHRERAKEETRSWNVVLISIDTLRADHLGSYGYGRPTSPRIDAIARRGVRFDRYYAQAPYTQPSHASLFTSLYPTVHGLNSVEAVIPPAADLLAEVLARNGYATASWNNGAYVSHEFGFSRGFDLYCEVDPIGDRYLDGNPPSGRRLSDGSAGSLSRALAWVDAMKDRRFFLFLHTFMVHEYQPPRALAESFNRGCASRLQPGPAARALFTPERFAGGRRPPEDLRFFVNMYDASIRAADAMVGEVMDRLEAAGLLDRTVVVITADHGEEFMEHGSVGHLYTVYDEVLHVPLVLYWPGVPGGAMVPFTVNEVDLMPTVLDLLGIRSKAPLQGRSLLPLVTGAERGGRPVYAETRLPHRSDRSCLVAGGWKYVRGETTPSLKYPAPAPEQLFHLAGDPGERKDLFHVERVRARALAGRLDRFEKELRRLRDVITRAGASKGTVSAELRALLHQQGYL